MNLGLNSYLSVFEWSPIKIKTVYDVGACNGWWYMGVRPSLPDANFFLFEANPEYEETLKQTGQRVFNKVLSNPGRGEVEFYNGTNTGDSYYKETTTIYDNQVPIKVPTITLDELIEQNDLPIPQLLKLDTQGSELDILQGATKLLGKTELIVTELPIIEYNKGAPNFSEYLNFFKSHDYIPVDVLEVHRGEETLIQLDVLFVLRSAKYQVLGKNQQVRV